MLFPVFAITMIVVAVWSSMRVHRSIAGPIGKLRESAKIIGTGNLDHHIGIMSDDEIGQLSMEFDRMAESLKKSTASRDELIREITERKRAEEALIDAHQRAVWLARFPDENPNPVLRVSIGNVLYCNPAIAVRWSCEEANPAVCCRCRRATQLGQVAQEDLQLGGVLFRLGYAIEGTSISTGGISPKISGGSKNARVRLTSWSLSIRPRGLLIWSRKQPPFSRSSPAVKLWASGLKREMIIPTMRPAGSRRSS
jgi:HAMP domain-containing protein